MNPTSEVAKLATILAGFDRATRAQALALLSVRERRDRGKASTPRCALGDRFVRSRKIAKPGTRDVFRDTILPGLRLRVSDKGTKSFVLLKRYPSNPTEPASRLLGHYPELSLEGAREKARRWIEKIQKGQDPRTEEARQQAAQARQAAGSFAAVAEAFLTRPGAMRLKKIGIMRHLLTVEFIQRWTDRPIDDISRAEVIAAINAIVQRGAPAQAAICFSYLRALFNWAGAAGLLESSPMAGLSATALCGERKPRQRTLSDDELRRVWSAARESGYPYGDATRLLMLTGQRLNEIAGARWSEINLDERRLIINGNRMKSGAEHRVPLAEPALEILRTIPRFTGDYVFTNRNGALPIHMGSKFKKKLDALSGVTGWVLHDLRRSARSHFSALPAEETVRELILDHQRKGMARVYDRFSFSQEKAQLMNLWSKRLLAIVEPPPANLVDLRAVRTETPARA